ncbi:patatin-like phospholipase family protein [Undibacterium arcticum]|uniref:Patatin-like phospholipase family protein n=1 Tax=Undibacterium arcticum TaxID=1762892 RepID=A0ABV7F2Z1_9BURK
MSQSARTASALTIQAGPRALAHLRQHGLRAQDIALIPGAAGGPKGLILQALDQWLFGHWLPSAPRERMLIGASIGAWRMAAACHADPVAAFQRLGDLYCGQCYPLRPSSAQVSQVAAQLLADFIGGHEAELCSHPYYRLQLLAVRGRQLLAAPRGWLGTGTGFAAAGLANLASRARLAGHLERIVIGDPRDPADWLRQQFDAFETRFVPLTPDNVGAALLASSSLPLMMEPVRQIPHAPAGTYWDGGLIDYHLALPYSRIADQPDGGLVLYPHFTDRVIPGWLDKWLPWRRAGRGDRDRLQRGWLDNVILVSPSPGFVHSLVRHKLPDRKDFTYHGQDHEARIRHWQQAVAEGERLRDALAEFALRPDLDQVLPL